MTASMTVDDFGLEIESVNPVCIRPLFIPNYDDPNDMIDNPLPDQVDARKAKNDFLRINYSKILYAYKTKELCQEHSVVPEYISSFQKWYHDYLSDPKNQDPNDMIDKRHLILDWWDEGKGYHQR